MNRPHSPRAAHARHHLHRPPATRPLPVGLRPQRWQRWAVHASTLALTLTGIAWLLAHHLLRSTGTFGEELPSPIEPWALRLHGMLAQVFLLVLGSMSAVHIVFGWRLKRSLWSGGGLVALSGVLLTSGLALYYAPEHWHAGASLLHWGTGLGLLPLVWVHVLAARRSRPQPPRVSAD
ncbi:DUF4405 domain-containing protein [Pelomonas aquatica]|uniref:DUF4405 domain-containing protein n=1 Tax=Pelomonas aquatica TaxID=431058 RepID=A0A9X4R593_9BURK|nr:DUF4405 domain-containing protein [Pelomonas aquatica]MCY4755937.1 DUF4405 domain-containing protein [Pelomonas aquatica]MDG0862964.1 DUF4405 domain-containing protein [Pelomonas aquatica]